MSKYQLSELNEYKIKEIGGQSIHRENDEIIFNNDNMGNI